MVCRNLFIPFFLKLKQYKIFLINKMYFITCGDVLFSIVHKMYTKNYHPSSKTHLCTYVFKEQSNLFNLDLNPSLNEEEKIQFEA